MRHASGGEASDERPFIGLRPFAYEDAAFFFGRDQQIAALQALLATHRLVSVVGSSGSGKSSLVRAGLLPRLGVPRGGGRAWIELRPGEAPIRHLAEALAGHGATARPAADDDLAEARADRIEMLLLESSFGIREALPLMPDRGAQAPVILVDQFEEIFRFTDLRRLRQEDPTLAAEQRDEAARFVQLLLTAVEDPDCPVSIILTMRSDFIGDCARFYGLSEAVSRSQYLVPGLTRDQRALAIRQPVEAAGGSIEPALVQRLLNDSSDDPDPLPILQHAMMRCWQRAAGESAGAPHLSLQTYEAVGTIAGALSQHGDEILHEFVSGEGPGEHGYDPNLVAQRLFQALTETDGSNRAIRRPQQLGALAALIAPDGATEDERAAAAEAMRTAVLRFADPDCSFLRISREHGLRAESFVDIGHEALIRRWGKLGGPQPDSWIRQEQDDRGNLQALDLLQRSDSLLAAGPLERYEEWWQRRRPNRAWAERYGDETMLDRAAAVLSESRASIERRRRDRRRQKTVVWSLALALVVAVVAAGGYWLWREGREAEVRRAESEQRALDLERDRSRHVAVLGAYALTRLSALKALLIALHGLKQEDGLVYVPELEALAYRMLQSPNMTGTQQLQRWSPATFLADGTPVTVDGDNLQWREPRTLAPLGDSVDLPSAGFYVDASDRHGRLLVAGFDAGWLYGRDGTRYDMPADASSRGVFSRDGQHLLTGYFNRAAAVTPVGEDGTLGEPVVLKTDQDRSVNPFSLAVSADSRYFALGAFDGRIHLWSVADRSYLGALDQIGGCTKPGQESQAAVRTGRDFILQLSFDPTDADRLLATSGDSKLCLWSVAGRTATQLTAIAPEPSRAIFSPDGRLIAVGARDGRLWLWDDAAQRLLSEPLITGTSDFNILAFDPRDPARLMAVNSDGVLSIWRLRSPLAADPPAEPPAGPSSQPPLATGGGTTLTAEQGRYLIASGQSGVLSGELGALAGAPPPAAAAISADGQWLAWAPREGRLLLFALARPLVTMPVAQFGRADSTWTAVGFATDPDRVVARGTGGTLSAWRYFPSVDALIAFGRTLIPATNMPGVQVLTESDLQLLRGRFDLFVESQTAP